MSVRKWRYFRQNAWIRTEAAVWLTESDYKLDKQQLPDSVWCFGMQTGLDAGPTKSFCSVVLGLGLTKF